MSTVSLIGSGNVAWHLAHVLSHGGVSVEWIWSRQAGHAESLAREVKGQPTTRMSDVSRSSGAVLVCVPDHAIPDVLVEAADSGLSSHLVCHTSGATPVDVFPPAYSRFGVFYPLQTLTKGHHVDFDHLPVLITSHDHAVQHELTGPANRITDRVVYVTDVERRQIHMAAVMVNNFVYHLCDRAFSRVESQGLDGSLLYPLLKETVRKIVDFRQEGVQTGPAIRHDLNTLYAHLKLLADEPGLASMYRQLSRSINPELEL